MILRFNRAYDNGTVRLAAGETTDALSGGIAARLVRSGLAEAVEGEEALVIARANAGLSPIIVPAHDEFSPDCPDERPLATMAMTRAALFGIAEERGVTIESDDNKADIVRKINEAG